MRIMAYTWAARCVSFASPFFPQIINSHRRCDVQWWDAVRPGLSYSRGTSLPWRLIMALYIAGRPVFASHARVFVCVRVASHKLTLLNSLQLRKKGNLHTIPRT